MAKWGEGDPRWIVEERPDATNVNNWHWTEKNADSWSKKKLEELFTGLEINDAAVGKVMLNELSKCEGEARVNNRKAKLIFFYEWVLVIKWKGVVNGSAEEWEGEIEIPNLSEEHEDMDEVDLEVSVKKSGAESLALKEMMRKGTGAKKIRENLADYVTALKTEFGSDLILPAKDSLKSTPQPSKQTKTQSTTMINKSTAASVGMKNLNIGTKITTTTLEMKETFKCTGQELYNTLTQKEMLQIFTGGDVEMKEAKKDEPFKMLGGNVQGVFLELVPFTKIVQKWRLKTWPAGHYSTVEINIKQSEEDTSISLKQTAVPEKEMENTRMGWKRYYWEAIKRIFGFGSSIF